MGMVDAMQNEEGSPYHPRARIDLGRVPRRNQWRDRTGRMRARPWLQSLQNEVRNGALSETNHAFLHGFATPVPGSWTWNGQRLECNQAACQKLLREKAAPEAILRFECDACKNARRSKARVADGSTNAAGKFAGAKAIFATNAVKYHVNKLRAKAWAAETRQVLHHAIAKDRISSVALCEKPDLGKENCHGCSDTIRTVGPCMVYCRCALVCQWLPQITWIAAVEFYVGGAKQETTQIWNELPACILVRFKTKTAWRVDGIDEDNVFPVAPPKKPWYLDKGRKRPVLRVFGSSFHWLQGLPRPPMQPKGKLAKKALSWTCTLVQQAACAFESWLAQHRSCNGDHVCSKLLEIPDSLEEHQQSGATGSCNAGESSNAGRARKKARVVADVWAAIAERKRKRMQEVAKAQEAPPPAKQRREDDGTERTTDRPAEISCAQADDASATEKDGVVKEKAYDYICPACKGNVASWQTAGLNGNKKLLMRQKKPIDVALLPAIDVALATFACGVGMPLLPWQATKEPSSTPPVVPGAAPALAGAWRLVTLTFTLCGRRATLGLVTCLGAGGAASLWVAGVAFGDIGLHFVWQAWRFATSTFTLCGRRGTYGTQLGRVTRLVAFGAASFCVAGVALGDMELRFVWQAWHFATSTFTLCGRRGTYGTQLGLVTRLAWHSVTWSFVLCGRRGTYGTQLGQVTRLVAFGAASFCVAGVALGDMELRFVWQAWHLATSTFTLCGRRGTYGAQLGLVTRLVFCVAGVALGDIDLHFVWQAWHLRRSAGSGDALGRVWRRGCLRGRRGAW
eukprot:s279_g18.t1